MALPRRCALSLHLRRRPGALLLATTRLSRYPSRAVLRRPHPPRIPHRKELRPALHRVVRPPGVSARFLARPATSSRGDARRRPGADRVTPEFLVTVISEFLVPTTTPTPCHASPLGS